LTIEHVGSTAVPRLAGKPILDIGVLLKSAEDFPRAIAALASIGCHHRGDLAGPGREAFRALPAIFVTTSMSAPTPRGISGTLRFGTTGVPTRRGPTHKPPGNAS